MLKSFCATALLLVCLPVAATAQTAQQRQGTPDEQKACVKDVSRHCRAVMNEGDLVVLACLQQHRNEISPACNKVLTDHGQ
jgi:hypothetical protein